MNQHAVLRNSGLVLLIYIAALGFAYRVVWNGRATVVGFALAFAATQAVLVGAICSALAITRILRQSLALRAQALQPRIRECLSAAARDRLEPASPSRVWLQRNRRAVEPALLEMLPLVSGSGKLRLSEIAAELGYVRKWEAATRSPFAGRRRRAEFSLSLLPPRPAEDSGVPARAAPHGDENVEMAPPVFERLRDMPLLQRVLLADRLRRDAGLLCEGALPRALRSPDAGVVLGALEMCRAWKRMLVLPALYPLLRHADARVRAAALRVLIYETGSRASRGAAADVLELLRDSDAEVRRAAADAAAALRLSEGANLLEQVLSDENHGVIRSGCYALAALGPEGSRRLENQIVAGTRAAALAGEALEHVRIHARGDLG